MDKSLEPVDRKALYDEIWAEPVSIVAPRYGLSDVGLAKLCKKLAIPLPSRGYWAKVRAGKIMGRAALPPLPDASFVQLPTRVPAKEAARLVESKAAQRHARAAIRNGYDDATVSVEHPLVAKAKKRLSTDRGWDDPKGLRHAPKETLDISVSSSSLERALNLAIGILRLLEARGASVKVDHEKGRTDIVWEATSLWFAISEKISRSAHVKTPEEERQQRQHYDSWRTGRHVASPQIPDFDYTPTGLLTISVGGRNWNDTARTTLDDRLEAVAADILAHFIKTRDEQAERARKHAAAAAQMAAYEAIIQKRKTEQQLEKRLVRESWQCYRAELVRKYVAAALAQGPAPNATQESLAEWASWALLKADHIDPLVQMSDMILDAPELARPKTWWW